MKKQTFITLSILLCILIGCKEKPEITPPCKPLVISIRWLTRDSTDPKENSIAMDLAIKILMENGGGTIFLPNGYISDPQSVHFVDTSGYSYKIRNQK